VQLLTTPARNHERSPTRSGESVPERLGSRHRRLDPDTLLHLKLSPGDIIEIEGAETTAAKVWRADRQDWNTDTVRVDGFTRQNADVGIGERVTIRKAEAEKAEKLVLAPPEASVQFGSDAAGMVKRQILKRPVVERDIVPVMSSTNHPFMRSPGQAIPLIAVDTEPDGVCLITETPKSNCARSRSPGSRRPAAVSPTRISAGSSRRSSASARWSSCR